MSPSPLAYSFEQPSQSPSKRPLGVFLFGFIFLVFLLSVGAWAGLYFYRVSLQDQVKTSRADIEKFEKGVDVDKMQKLLRIYEVAKSSKSLLDDHVQASEIFRFLESKTHPRLRYKSFSFIGDRRGVKVSGETVDYRTLAEQIIKLEELPEINSVEFGNLNFVNNRLSFNLTLALSKDLLRFK